LLSPFNPTPAPQGANKSTIRQTMPYSNANNHEAAKLISVCSAQHFASFFLFLCLSGLSATTPAGRQFLRLCSP
jgi:hypothetical protein